MSKSAIKAKALKEAGEILSGAPTSEEIATGDKAGLGQLGVVIEQAAAAAQDGATSVAQLLTELGARLDAMILDEDPNPEQLHDFLFEAIAALTETAGDAKGAVAVVEGLTARLAELSGADEPEAEAEVETVEKPMPVDQVNINGPEDVVIYAEFIGESLEHLERIEESTLAMESGGLDVDLVNDIFRCFHSMKGAAGFLGLIAINGLCHEVETMLDRVRKMTLAFDGDVIEVLLAAIDTAKRLLEVLQMRVDQGEGKLDKDAEVPAIDTRPVVAAVQQILNRPPAVARAIAPSDETQPDPGRVGGQLLAEGAINQEQLREALVRQKKPVGEILVEMGATTPDKVEGAVQRTKTRIGSSSIKVDTVRLDALMEMVGELVISQSQVAQDDALWKDESQKLAKNVDAMGKITTQLQELVMALRLVPLKQTFARMNRLVRDTALKTGKEVQLVVAGEETEIDKTVSEELSDPLVHLMRNAVDHGCEKPDEREAAGKPREGTIWLSAFHEGGNVVIEIRDDGAGIDRDRVLEKARERGLVAENETLSDEEIFEFIMHPGFSTAKAVTDVSGRGVGMDVVKRNIERLGGRIDIASEPGNGSTFSVRLPLTMAIVDGMVVKVGRERYIVPTLSIEESLRPTDEQVSTVQGQGEVMMMRGDLIPIVHLGGLFDAADAIHDPCDALVIVVSANGNRCGLVVDELQGQQQVVIKNLGKRLKGIRGLSGGCIMGDGRVGLIVDVPGLIDLSRNE